MTHSRKHTYAPHEHTFAVCAYKESPYLEECLLSVTQQNTPTRVIISTSTPNEHIRTLAKKFGVELFERGQKVCMQDTNKENASAREGATKEKYPQNKGEKNTQAQGTNTSNMHSQSENANKKQTNVLSTGIGADWNTAIACANTPLVTIAHQDDVYLPNYSKHMFEAVNSANTPLLFFTDYGEIREAHVGKTTSDNVQLGQNTSTQTATPQPTTSQPATPPQIIDSNKLLEVKRKMLAPLKTPKNATSIRTRRRILSLGSAICCPSVTVCTDNVPTPLFNTTMKCSLDWDAWERVSRMEGAFLYDPHILMRHRIHIASETTALIENNTRGSEDLDMLKRFWPVPIAHAIYFFYSKSQNSNG